MKTLIALVIWAIPHEDTKFGSKVHFMSIKGAKVEPTSGSKNVHEFVVRNFVKQFLER